VRCAVDIQRGMADRNAEVPADRRIEFRIGINVGDIISIDGPLAVERSFLAAAMGLTAVAAALSRTNCAR
jgi:class 3 adenylate cyclase